jgi:hypothetical protein
MSLIIKYLRDIIKIASKNQKTIIFAAKKWSRQGGIDAVANAAKSRSDVMEKWSRQGGIDAVANAAKSRSDVMEKWSRQGGIDAVANAAKSRSDVMEKWQSGLMRRS